MRLFSTPDARCGARRSLVPLLAALIAAPALTCRPDPTKFYDKVYSCDKTVGGIECGTNASGQPMQCYHARQFGGGDFCVDSCDGDVAASSTETSTCLESKAVLQRCSPGAKVAGQQTCPNPLSCYRTDLLSDEGVCSTFELCSPDEPCTDPARTTCASTVLHALYPFADLKLSNLYCVQLGCKAKGSACSPSEVCLPNLLPASSRPFDLCVPQCDANKLCPPNFVCLSKASSPANPDVCVPGLLGFRCVTSNDCMLGDCVATGEGFNVCTIPCDSDATCAPVSGPRAAFKCLAPVAGGPKFCMAPESFGGAGCARDSNCGKGEKCSFFSPFNTVVKLGSCLIPCEADGSCRSRGGVPHTCFEDQGVCYPGEFGLHCKSDANCFGGNKCLPSNPKHDAVPPLVCTTAKPCDTDMDCTLDKVSSTSSGWCNVDDHTCAPGQGIGFPCTRAIQCASGVCAPAAGPDGGVVMKCTARPGEAP